MRIDRTYFRLLFNPSRLAELKTVHNKLNKISVPIKYNEIWQSSWCVINVEKKMLLYFNKLVVYKQLTANDMQSC